MLIVFVKIAGAGSGTNSVLGLNANDLLWSSVVDSLGAYTAGFVDNKTVRGVAAACNISQGGNIGSFDGTVSIGAFSTDVVSALLNGTLSVIGKTITVKIGTTNVESASILRYTGVIGAWACPNEYSAVLTASPQAVFNKKVIPSATVNKDMALGVINSSAIGKEITTTYGNICDFPLVWLDKTKSMNPLAIETNVLADDGSTLVMDTTAIRINGTSDQASNVLEYKGAALFQILAVWQLTTDVTQLWICLSFNGQQLFTTAGESYVSLIKKNLIGMNMNVVRGVGQGSTYTIVDVAGAVHRQASIDIDTVWFQINETTKANIKGAGGYSSDSMYSGTANNPYTNLGTDITLTQSRDSISTVSDVSFVEFSSACNLFFVSHDVDLTQPVKLVCDTGANGTTITVPSSNVIVIYDTPIWKMILLTVANIISDKGTSFSFVQFFPVRSFIRQSADGFHTAPNKQNTIRYTRYLGTPIYTNDWFPDQMELTTGIDQTSTVTIPNGSTNTGDAAESLNTFYISVEGLLNGVDISGVDNTQLIPTIKLSFMYALLWAGAYPSMHITVQTVVISEGNVVTALSNFDDTISFDLGACAALPMQPVSFEIDPTIGAFKYADSLNPPRDRDRIDYSGFSRLKSTMDLANALKGAGSASIRYIGVMVYASVSGCSIDPAGAGNTLIIKKTLYPAQLGTSVSVDKSKLFLRAQRNNAGSGYAVQSPALLAASIAKENGLSVDSSSFVTTHAIQRTLFSSVASAFTGQFKPSNSTAVIDAIMEICRTAMLSVYPKPTGILNCLWFADNTQSSSSSYTFDGTKIKKGSLAVSKPNNGYRYTDYVFDVKKNGYQNADSLYVNTDPSNVTASFPSVYTNTTIGTLYNAANGYALQVVRRYLSDLLLGVRILSAASIFLEFTAITRSEKF